MAVWMLQIFIKNTMMLTKALVGAALNPTSPVSAAECGRSWHDDPNGHRFALHSMYIVGGEAQIPFLAKRRSHSVIVCHRVRCLRSRHTCSYAQMLAAIVACAFAQIKDDDLVDTVDDDGLVVDHQRGLATGLGCAGVFLILLIVMSVVVRSFRRPPSLLNIAPHLRNIFCGAASPCPLFFFSEIC
jgi:hypothetical protein